MENEYEGKKFLFISNETLAGMDFVNLFVTRVDWLEYDNRYAIVTVDHKDFDYKSTRYFAHWNIYMKFFNHDGETYNQFELHCDSVNSNDVNDVAKTMNSIEKQWYKIVEKRGYSPNVIETIIRYMEVLKLDGVVYRTADTNSISVTYMDGDLAYAIKQGFLKSGISL